MSTITDIGMEASQRQVKEASMQSVTQTIAVSTTTR